MSESTSVGNIQLDVTVSKDSISKEIRKLNSMFSGNDVTKGLRDSLDSFNKGIGTSIENFSKSINNFVKNDLENMNKSIQEAATSLDAIKNPPKVDIPEAEITAPTMDTDVTEKTFINPFSRIRAFMKDTMTKMGEDQKNFAQVGSKSNKKVAQSANKINAEYEKTSSRIAEIRSEIAKLFAEQDDVAKAFQDMPAFSGMTKEASMEQMLKNNPRYNELSAQIDTLSAKLDPLVEKNRILADEIKNVGAAASTTSKNINSVGGSSKKAGRDMDKASKKTKTFGDVMKRTGKQSGGFASMISRSFMTILRRMFVYNLILKAIRSLISYMSSALSTNKQFASSLNAVKTNLRVAFQPIYDFILPALNALMQAVAKVTAYIAAAISALFGKSYKQSYDSAKGIETAKKAMDGYGGAAKKAGKEVKGALMGFDEINQLDISDDEDDSGGGGGAGDFEMEMPDMSTIDMTGIERFKEIMASILEPFKLAWENEGQATIEAMKNAFSSVLDLIKSIGSSWREVWTNGTGQRIVENILGIIQNIFNIVGNLATAFKSAWEQNDIGTRILQRVLDIFNIILDTIKRITGSTAEWAKTLDFYPLLASIEGLLAALEPLTQNIGAGLVWFWENALLPIAGWVIQDAVPVFLNVLAEAIRVVNNVIDALKPLGAWLWENFLKPLAEWTGGVIVSVLEGIKDALKGIGDWVVENEAKVQAFFAVFATWKATTFAIEMSKATAAVIAHTIAVTASKVETLILIGLYAKDAIAKGISAAATWGQVAATTAWNVIAGIATGVTAAFGAAVAFLTSPIGIVIIAIGALIAAVVLLWNHWDWIVEKVKWVAEKIVEFFAWLYDVLVGHSIIPDLVNEVTEWFTNLGKWVGEKVKALVDAVIKFFTDLWDNIKAKTEEMWNGLTTFLDTTWNNIKTSISTILDAIKTNIERFSSSFKSTWDKLWGGVKTVFSDVWDSFTGIVKGVINGIIGIVNKFISFWNNIELKVPAVNIPGVGKVGGFSIGVPKLDKIPMLARGGIIDQPTLAMVGERGKEAVIPFENSGFLEALTGSIVNALLQAIPFLSGGQAGQGSEDKDIIVNLDGLPLVRIILPLINDELTRLGYRTIYQLG